MSRLPWPAGNPNRRRSQPFEFPPRNNPFWKRSTDQDANDTTFTHQTVRKEQGVEPSKFRPTIDKYAPLYHVRKDAPPTLCITGGWEVDMLMRAEENLYFVSMLKLVGHKAVKHIVIEGADHGQCGAACWPHVIVFIEHRLAEM